MGGSSGELRRLAHSVLQPGFAGTSTPQWLAEAIDDGLISVCYFGHNIEAEAQTAALSADLHQRGIALIATDEEGGIVSRLGAHSGSRHVGAAALGHVDDTDLTRQVAARIGADLRAAGIDIDLAPVADINSNPANPVIGVRSFGADPRTVARHASAYARGLADQAVLACAKHFPGHGDTAVDSHVGMPRVDVPLETLRTREFLPFEALAHERIPMIMTGHILLPALDPAHPATLSPSIIAMLREQFGFDGVVVSDALDMGAVSDTVGLAQGCVDALAAGCDLLGLGNPVLGRPDGSDQRIYASAVTAIEQAVTSGELAYERLADAAARVARLGRDRANATSRSATPCDDDHVDLRAATLSLRARGIQPGVLAGRPLRVLDVRRQRNVASGVLTSLVARRLLQAGGTMDQAFAVPTGIEGHAVDVSDLVARPMGPPPDVIITGTPGLDEAEQRQLRQGLAANPEAVVVCVGYVADPHRLPEARQVVFTLGDSLPTAQAVCNLLQ